MSSSIACLSQLRSSSRKVWSVQLGRCDRIPWQSARRKRGLNLGGRRHQCTLAYDTFTPEVASGQQKQKTESDAARQEQTSSPDRCGLLRSPPLLLLHGLLGSKQNWRTLARQMSQTLNTKVLAIDLRNHGSSPHTSTMSFDEISADLDGVLRQEKITSDFHLLGHSMGGKVAMHWALAKSRQPLHLPRIAKLVVVDIAPLPKTLSPSFSAYLRMMRQINERATPYRSKKEADVELAQIEPVHHLPLHQASEAVHAGSCAHVDRSEHLNIKDLAVRQFLLTNLKVVDKASGGMRFQVGLDAIERFLPELAGFPFFDRKEKTQFNRPMRLIKGSRSDYVSQEQYALIREQFPTCEFVSMDTGHWVHAERPREFLTHVTDFLRR